MERLIQNCEQELKQYIDLLLKWQKAVNLVSSSTLSDCWNRHILDSAQIYPFIPNTARTLVDMGSGAGFPALVLAIINQKNNGPVQQFILIESDTKKSLFLKEVVRCLSLPVQVLNQRIEHALIDGADVVTARALAPLQQLLILGQKFITPQTICFFLKGKTAPQEIKNCSIPCQIESIKSVTNSDSFLLKVTEVSYG